MRGSSRVSHRKGLAPQRLASLSSTIVEFACLSNDDGSSTDNCGWRKARTLLMFVVHFSPDTFLLTHDGLDVPALLKFRHCNLPWELATAIGSRNHSRFSGHSGPSMVQDATRLHHSITRISHRYGIEVLIIRVLTTPNGSTSGRFY